LKTAVQGGVCLLLLLVLGFVVLSTQISAQERFPKYRLSVPDFKIGANERVDGFTITVKYGDIIAVPRIPTGWSMHIDNSPAWKTVVSASISLGVAALTHKETDFFNNFLIIQSNDKDFPMLVEADITTYEMGSSEKQTHRAFKNTDLRLEPIKE
jgi:hypothetical protein